MRIDFVKSDVTAVGVPFYDYAALGRERGPELLTQIEAVLRRGAFIMQAEVSQFEANLASYLGAGEVVGVGNCTDGLELILLASGIGPGDEVILPAHTFVATAGAVVAVGATPRFAEVGPAHDIDPADLMRVASPRTKAVIPVSLNGRCADLDAVVDIASSQGWLVIEDAAQAVGARLNGRAAGTWGIAGAFSFYPAKTLGAVGDAGAIVTTDAELAERLRMLRDHGRTDAGEVRSWGRNSRLDNLQAAVLLVQLQHYDTDVRRRRDIAARYLDELGGVSSLRLPELDSAGRFDVCQNFEIEADDRDQLKLALSEKGIGTALPWGGKAITDFEGLKTTDATPRTSELLQSLLLLPLHQYMEDRDVDAVIEAVLAVRV